jgi:hypothetical protein
MDASKKILLVTNLVNETEINQIRQALEEAKKQNLSIDLSLIHVNPSIPTCYFNILSMGQLTEQYYEEAKCCLTLAGEALNVDKKNQWLMTGRLKTEVLRLSRKLRCDYILAHSTQAHHWQQALAIKKEQLALLFHSMKPMLLKFPNSAHTTDHNLMVKNAKCFGN